MLRFIIILTVVIAAVIFIIYTFFTFFLGISGTKSVFSKDLDRFIADLKSIELSPWKMDELDLLTRNGDSSTIENIFSYTETGVIFSIYQEPLLAYALKQYKTNGIKIIVIRVNDDIFHYRLQGKKIFVIQNGEEIGFLRIKDRILFEGENQRIEIPHLEKRDKIPVSINDKHILSINAFIENMPNEGRVLETIEKYDLEQAQSFLATLAYAIVDEQI